jgi:pyruvate/2-oxoacid:ferredoxin oxidoreductase alpha subunit
MGAVFAGVTVVAWYPITPSTSVVEATTDLLKKLRVTPEGKATYAVVQAEDELAAIGMVLGAGWAGARSMTATSGPGISLMAEFSGLGYYAEIPGVIFDVQRTGPSTGMPTRTSQADLLSVAFLSHGDTKHIVLLPGNVKECYELGYAAFDLAERLQTPVFVLSDLDLGMNNWMSDPFDYPTTPQDRGKVLTKEDLDKLGGFARYRDVDGDAIGWRTLPGTDHPKAAYFTRGSGHNDAAGYTEKPDEYVEVMERLSRKFENARKLVPGSDCGEGWSVEDRVPGLRQHGLCAAREPGPDQEGIRAGCGLHAHPGLSVCARDSRLCGLARARVRGGAGPRCATGEPAEAGSSRRACDKAAQHSALQRIAVGRPHDYRRVCDQGGPLNGYRNSTEYASGSQGQPYRPSGS